MLQASRDDQDRYGPWIERSLGVTGVSDPACETDTRTYTPKLANVTPGGRSTTETLRNSVVGVTGFEPATYTSRMTGRDR